MKLCFSARARSTDEPATFLASPLAEAGKVSNGGGGAHRGGTDTYFLPFGFFREQPTGVAHERRHSSTGISEDDSLEETSSVFAGHPFPYFFFFSPAPLTLGVHANKDAPP